MFSFRLDDPVFVASRVRIHTDWLGVELALTIEHCTVNWVPC